MEDALTAAAPLERLAALGNAQDARFLQRYFKTGPGEYGAGDRFLGIRVPAVRRLVRSLDPLPLEEVDTLLQSQWHEARLLALLGLVRRYERGDAAARAAVYRLYFARTVFINNWDLVDVSAPRVVGAHLLTRSHAPLHRLSRSGSLWERRIAIMATMRFIAEGDVADTLVLADCLLGDDHDLIHKATGWALREAWKVAPEAVAGFVRERRARMPRTMLRYAIEKQPPAERRAWLAK